MPLHANWDTHSLHVWDRGLTTPEQLRDVVAEVCGDALVAAAAVPDALALWLPQDGKLGPTTVPTLRLAPADAVDFLLGCPPSGASSSLRYWSMLAGFVMRHIAGEQFFPDIETHDAVLHGIWRLVISECDIDRLERFALAMPPVCRAIAMDPPHEPARLIESFLNQGVDCVIRRDVQHDPFFLRVHELAKEPNAPAELRWVSSLLGDDHVVRVEPNAATRLQEQVRTWVGQLSEGRADAPWQLGFVLHEPPDDEGDEIDPQAELWHVSFRLLPPGEDAQPIDAADLWHSQVGTGPILGRKLAERQQQFRADLAAASEMFPPLQRVLGDPEPTGVDLATPEAHVFIRTWSQQLLSAGFPVEVPEWATRRESAPGLLLDLHPHDDDGPDLLTFATGNGDGGPQISADRGGRFGLDVLLSFDWQVAVGDLRLSPERFRELAGRKLSLVKIQGKWMQLDVQAAERAAEFLERRSTGKITLGEAFRTAFGAIRAENGVPVVGLSGTSWIAQLLDQAPAARLQTLHQPRSFAGELRPYQLRGLDWLWFLDRMGIGACLADDMGLGKTIQFIALLQQEREMNGRHVGPTLLFAPTSVVGNWLRELNRFAPALNVLVHHGPQRSRGDAFVETAQKSDVVITSYALAHRDHADLRRPDWHRIALDEAQKIKNPYAASTQAIRSIAAPHRVALTGTPVENHLAELWSIMEVLNPGLLGSAGEFRERFAVPIEKLGDRERAAQLRRLIQPFVLRRSKNDPTIVTDLPDKLEMKVYCNLTPEQAAMYERITGEMLGQVDAAEGIQRRALVLAALTRLKQICNHPELILKDNGELAGRSGKCERLVEMLEEVIEEGDRALVFTQFREMGHLLEKLLVARFGQTIQFLHGGTPARQRDTMIETFQAPDSPVRIFLLSLRAGGLGLNLTAANHVFHFDRWWNPAVESQATDRAHRIGQTRKVQVHKFVCIGTVEERIDQLLTDKMALADKIVGSGDEWLTNLSTNELRKAIELQETAVAEF